MTRAGNYGGRGKTARQAKRAFVIFLLCFSIPRSLSFSPLSPGGIPILLKKEEEGEEEEEEEEREKSSGVWCVCIPLLHSCKYVSTFKRLQPLSLSIFL